MSQLHGDQLAAEELQASVNASSVVYAAYNQLDLESQGIRLSRTGRGNGDMRETASYHDISFSIEENILGVNDLYYFDKISIPKIPDVPNP